jgi:hypothetical protein
MKISKYFTAAVGDVAAIPDGLSECLPGRLDHAEWVGDGVGHQARREPNECVPQQLPKQCHAEKCMRIVINLANLG